MGVPSASTLFDPGYNAGARIHSASWGTPDANAYTPYDLQIDEYAYENPEFLFIAAAGNAGRGNSANTVASPATAKNGISVGASQNTGDHIKDDQRGPDYLIDFSSRGPTADGRAKPDVVAPGQFILSANAVSEVIGECDDTPNDGLRLKKGTSMATPIVSGTAALVRQYFVEGWHLTGKSQPSSGFSPMASLVKAVLLNGAQELAGIEDDDGKITNSKAYDRNQGFGRVNLLRSLPLALKNDIGAMFVNAQRIDNGGVDTYEVRIDSSSGCSDPLSATLVWTDIPGSPSCNQGCVLNDLDLFVTQNGSDERFFPNGLGSADTVNNVERVRIDDPTDGATYAIHVQGSQLLQSQNYSLVITGCFSPSDNSNPAPTPPNPPTTTTTPTATPTSPPTRSPNEDISNDPNDDESETNQCVDRPGAISINAGRTEDCTWLGRNLDSFDYLCAFLDVALECPVTCDTCSLLRPGGNAGESVESALRTAFSSLDGKVRWFGTTFDVRVKQNPVTVSGFDIHISTQGQYTVQVFTRPGRLSAVPGGWTEICEAVVSSPGRGELTEIPASACTPVAIAAKTFQTFYVTLGGGTPELVLTDEGGLVNKTIYNDNDLRVRTGFAVTYFDQDYFGGYSLNGGVRYTVTTTQPSTCNDQSGTVAMDDNAGERTCAWLTENWDRFEFVCQFAAPSLHCPETCSVCSQLSN